MKKILPVIIIIAVILIGGHYLLWKQQSALLSENAEQIIRQSSAVEGAEHITFSFDKKETGGYPASVTINYTNPVLHIAPEFYETQTAQHNADMPQFSKIALAGELTVRNAYLNNTTSVEMEGTLAMNGAKDGTPLDYTASWDDISRCSVTLAGTPVSFITQSHPINTAKTIGEKIRALREVYCHTDDLVVRDTIAATDIMRVDAQTIRLTSSDSDIADNHIVGLDMDIKDLEISSDPKQVIAEIRASLAPVDDREASFLALLEKHPVALLDNSYSGKNTIYVKGTYNGPLEKENLNNLAHGMVVDIEEARISNDIYDASFPVRLDVEPAGETKSFFLRHEGTSRYKPAFNDIINDSIDSLVQIMHSPELDVDDTLRARLMRIDETMLHNIVPDWAKLGTIKTLANIDVDQTKDSLVIESAGFTADPFGLTVAGQGSLKNKQMDAEITCTECADLLNSLMNYANDVQRVIAISGLMPQQKLVILNEEAKQAIINFITGLDRDNKEAGITKIAVNTDPSGALMIAGQPAVMVMMSAMQQLSPYFEGMMPQ